MTVKTIGSSGQIALGKEYAGRTVMVEQPEEGVWVIKLGEFVPDSERWLFESQAREELNEAVRWAETHAPQETDIDALQKTAETEE